MVIKESKLNTSGRMKVYMLVLLLVGVIGHLLYITAHSVNLEWAFFHVAKQLPIDGGSNNLSLYWHVEANPLGYPMAVALLAKLLHLPVTQAVARVPAVLGYIFIVLSGFLLHRKTNFSERQSLWWVALITFCPLIWIYTGSSTADIFPLGLLCLSLATCYLSRNRNFYLILASLIYGLSLICKFHGGLFALGFVYLLFINAEEKSWKLFLRALLVFAIPGLLVVGTYFYIIYQKYNIFILPHYYANMYTPSLGHSVINFVNYCSYLAMLLGPMALLPLMDCIKHFDWKKQIYLFGAFFSIAVVITLMVHARYGEMNFGGLDYILPAQALNLFNIISLFLFFIIMFHVFYFRKVNQKVSALLILTVIPYLILSSLVRPSQRYLMFLLPIIFLYVIIGVKLKSNIVKFVVSATVVFFIVTLAPELSYRLSEAKATGSVEKWLIRHAMMKHTDVKVLSGSYYDLYKSETKKWKVVLQKSPPPAYEFQYPVVMFGKKIKAYYVVRI